MKAERVSGATLRAYLEVDRVVRVPIRGLGDAVADEVFEKNKQNNNDKGGRVLIW